MTYDGKDNSAVLSWLDFPGSIDTDEDLARLLNLSRNRRGETVLSRLNQPMPPNVANSTLFILLWQESFDPHLIEDISSKYVNVNRAIS